MKGFRRLSSGLFMTLCVALTGCGTNLTQLTEAEQELIVAYASGVVAKANRSQSQGLTYLFEEEESDENVQEESKDTQDASGNGGSVSGTVETSADSSKATLTEVINIPSIIAEYQGYQVSDSYVEGDYFALNAQGNNTYLILHVKLTNTSQEAAECNVLAKKLTCSVRINGASAVEAMPTIMLNDFSTYIGSVEGATAEDTVLIFEVPKESVKEIQTLSMDVEADGTHYDIELE